MLDLQSNTMMGLTVFVKVAISTLGLPFTGAAVCPSSHDIETHLGKALSEGSTISNSTLSAPRWSLYAAPTPAFIVNIAAEKDVATTVFFSQDS